MDVKTKSNKSDKRNTRYNSLIARMWAICEQPQEKKFRWCSTIEQVKEFRKWSKVRRAERWRKYIPMPPRPIIATLPYSEGKLTLKDRFQFTRGRDGRIVRSTLFSKFNDLFYSSRVCAINPSPGRVNVSLSSGLNEEVVPPVTPLSASAVRDFFSEAAPIDEIRLKVERTSAGLKAPSTGFQDCSVDAGGAFADKGLKLDGNWFASPASDNFSDSSPDPETGEWPINRIHAADGRMPNDLYVGDDENSPIGRFYSPQASPDSADGVSWRTPQSVSLGEQFWADQGEASYIASASSRIKSPENNFATTTSSANTERVVNRYSSSSQENNIFYHSRPVNHGDLPNFEAVSGFSASDGAGIGMDNATKQALWGEYGPLQADVTEQKHKNLFSRLVGQYIYRRPSSGGKPPFTLNEPNDLPPSVDKEKEYYRSWVGERRHKISSWFGWSKKGGFKRTIEYPDGSTFETIFIKRPKSKISLWAEAISSFFKGAQFKVGSLFANRVKYENENPILDFILKVSSKAGFWKIFAAFLKAPWTIFMAYLGRWPWPDWWESRNNVKKGELYIITNPNGDLARVEKFFFHESLETGPTLLDALNGEPQAVEYFKDKLPSDDKFAKFYEESTFMVCLRYLTKWNKCLSEYVTDVRVVRSLYESFLGPVDSPFADSLGKVLDVYEAVNGYKETLTNTLEHINSFNYLCLQVAEAFPMSAGGYFCVVFLMSIGFGIFLAITVGGFRFIAYFFRKSLLLFKTNRKLFFLLCFLLAFFATAISIFILHLHFV